MIDRRQLLATGAALPLVPAAARAQSDAPATAATLADAQRFTVGEATVTALSDGALRIGPEALQGIDAEGYATLMEEQFRDPDTFRAAVNGWLVDEGGGELSLIDAGAGATMGDSLGRLMENLRATGTDPGQITRLVATHLHPDHVGGAMIDGAAAFPNAELVVSETERAFWTDDANMAEGSEDFFRIARQVLDLYGDRLSPISDEAEVTSGLTAVPLPGHTPGHTGVRLASGDTSVLIWADIVHVLPVQFAQPQVTVGFDVNPEQAAQTRERILDQVVTERTMIAGSHIDFPGLGHVKRDGSGYRLVDAPYPYSS